jgi:uncharacterized repeat protein (TIGR04076 family)
MNLAKPKEVMMFKVKITVVGFLGDEEKYPCHFQHKIGDEIIYDGEKFVGRLCSGVQTEVAEKALILFKAGPRYVEPGNYYAFWYAPVSAKDPSLKKYDGLGFRNVFETYKEPRYHMANMIPKNAFKWPPYEARDIAKDPIVVCGDVRTAVVFKLEAFDVADAGFVVPYFRRQMVILSKVLAKQGIQVAEILNEFSKEEIETIYPALSPIMIEILVEELELVGHVRVDDGKVTVTDKGAKKLEDFKASLPAEDREALNL